MNEAIVKLSASLLVTLSIALAVNGAAAQVRGGGDPLYHRVEASAEGLSPEDIAALPGTKWLIAGAGVGSTPGARAGISIIDTTNPAHIEPLYPAPSSSESFDAALYKGCPGPLAAGFAPHGIATERLPDGSYKLIVVNHRGRESLEVFHILQDGPLPRAVWQGCIVLPPPASGNSVVALPNNSGYIATNFLQRSDPHFLQSMENGTPTGNVLRWTPRDGWTEFSPQKFSGANGLEISPDGKWLFINEWSDYKVWKFPLDGVGPVQSIHLDFLPDNLRLTDHGTILIAGQNADPVNVMTCKQTHEPCQAPFTVLELDPTTMATRVFVHGGDADFGGATGAAMVGSSLWVSSYYSKKVAQFGPIH